MKDKYLACRDTGMGHKWSPSDAYYENSDIIQRLECSTCGTIKERRLTATGSIKSGSRMYYPEDYLRKGQGRMTKREKALVRLRNIRREHGWGKQS